MHHSLHPNLLYFRNSDTKTKTPLTEWLIKTLDHEVSGALWIKRDGLGGVFRINYGHGLCSGFKLEDIFNNYAEYQDQFDNKNRMAKSASYKKGLLRSALHSYLQNEKGLITLLSSNKKWKEYEILSGVTNNMKQPQNVSSVMEEHNYSHLLYDSYVNTHKDIWDPSLIQIDHNYHKLSR